MHNDAEPRRGQPERGVTPVTAFRKEHSSVMCLGGVMAVICTDLYVYANDSATITRGVLRHKAGLECSLRGEYRRISNRINVTLLIARISADRPV